MMMMITEIVAQRIFSFFNSKICSRVLLSFLVQYQRPVRFVSRILCVSEKHLKPRNLQHEKRQAEKLVKNLAPINPKIGQVAPKSTQHGAVALLIRPRNPIVCVLGAQCA